MQLRKCALDGALEFSLRGQQLLLTYLLAISLRLYGRVKVHFVTKARTFYFFIFLKKEKGIHAKPLMEKVKDILSLRTWKEKGGN